MAKALESVVDVVRGELRCVELLVKVSTAVVGEAVEALSVSNLLNEASTGECGEAHTRVAPRTDAEVRNRLRRQVSLLSHVFKDRIVNGAHPIPTLARHARILSRRAHRTTDVLTYGCNAYNTDGKPSVPLVIR